MPIAISRLIASRDKTRDKTRAGFSQFPTILVLFFSLAWGSVVSAQEQSPRPPEPAVPDAKKTPPRPPEPAVADAKTPLHPPEPAVADEKTPPPPIRPAALRILPHPPEPPSPVDVVFAKSGPSSVAELRLIQDHVRELSKKVVAATVGVRIGAAQGSGVIITGNGYVLTAGHVSGVPNRDVFLILPDGRVVKGKTLGANRGIDSGLIKITDENPDGGPWQHVGIGRSQTLTPGTWCLCTGHPGGYKRGRPPVVRLGRVLSSSKGAIVSDCTMVGGDSGGPLFNMDGDVIGINSRIGGPLTANIHVPVDTFRETWSRLAKSEVWGMKRGQPRQVRPGGPFLGIGAVPKGECKITQVRPDSPAAKAGMKIGDIVKKFDGKDVKSFPQLIGLVSKKKPQDKVSVELIREGKTITVEIQIGKRPG